MKAPRSAQGQGEKKTEHYQVHVCTSGRSPDETTQMFLTKGFSFCTNSLFPSPKTPFNSKITTPQHPPNTAGGAETPREQNSQYLTTKCCNFKTESWVHLQKSARNISLGRVPLKHLLNNRLYSSKEKKNLIIRDSKDNLISNRCKKMILFRHYEKYIYINENHSDCNCSHSYFEDAKHTALNTPFCSQKYRHK